MSLPLEKATYRARAINASLGISESEKKTRYVAVGFEVVEDESLNGETVTGLLFFSDKATARTIESLQYMGFASDDLSLLEDIDRDSCAALLPNVVEIVCEPEEYNGEWNLKVKWVNQPGHGRFKAKQPLVGNELKAFAAQMKSAFRNARAPGSGTKPRPTPSQGSAHPNAPGNSRDDDLPFASCDIAYEPSPIAAVLR